MRKEIEQIDNIVSLVRKINQLLKQENDNYNDNGGNDNEQVLISDVLGVVEQVNEFLFKNKEIVNYKVCEILKEYEKNTISKQLIVEEIERWCSFISEKINIMKDKDNFVDYEFYSFMNYVEMVPDEIILEDMKRNFQKISQYGDDVYRNTIGCYNFYNYWGKINPDEDVWDLLYDRLNQLKNHREDFIWLFEELVDYRSKMVLNGILHYWVEYDYKLATKINETNYNSYFDLDIIQPDPEEVFVDLGAYIGDTIEDFVRDMGIYKKIYCYEITKDTFEKLQKNLSKYENIVLNNKGVGEKNGVMYISDSADISANKIAEQGENEIEIVTLDEDIKEKITFIKMDIEGAEQQALKGAERHVREEKPKLAICTYHNNHDIWQIPRMIRDMNSEYKLYMRCNTVSGYVFNITEFLIYAV